LKTAECHPLFLLVETSLGFALNSFENPANVPVNRKVGVKIKKE
jgi:hypothetical protein